MQVKASYLIDIRGRIAKFIWSSTSGKPIKGSIDLKVRVEPTELLRLARKLNCTVNNGRIIAPTLDSYNRLLLYSAVRPTIRNGAKAGDLAFLTLTLNGYDVHYWASTIREMWWRHNRYSRLTRIVKAFKLFFDLS